MFDNLFKTSAPAQTPASGGLFNGLFAKNAPQPSFLSTLQANAASTTPTAAPSAPIIPSTSPVLPQISPQTTPNAFAGNLGGGYGSSNATDPNSGKPLLTFINPQAKASQLLTDRTAPTIDPTVPQKIDSSVLQNGRMPESVSQAIKAQFPGSAADELDHIMPLELGGSNEKSNLRLEPPDNTSKNYNPSSNPTNTDPLENSLAQKVQSGQMSLVDAWKAMAQAKGITLPEQGGKLASTNNIQPNTQPNEQPQPSLGQKIGGFFSGLFNGAKNDVSSLFGASPAKADTIPGAVPQTQPVPTTQPPIPYAPQPFNGSGAALDLSNSGSTESAPVPESNNMTVRAPFGKTGQNIPQAFTGGLTGVALALASRAPEMVAKGALQLVQSLRQIRNIESGTDSLQEDNGNVTLNEPTMKVPFDLTRLGDAPGTTGVQSIQKDLIDSFLSMQKSNPTNDPATSIKNALTASITTVVPDVLNVVAATDVAAGGTSLFAKGTIAYNPELDTALGRMGLDRSATYDDVKSAFVNTSFIRLRLARST